MNSRYYCTACLRPANHCYCEHIVTRENFFPIKIIQSPTESRHPFNTGRIADLSLSNCEIKIADNNDDLTKWITTLLPNDPVLAFPDKNATDISRLELKSDTPIIFIDDTWRKAKRMLYENALLNSLPKMCLPVSDTSNYQLRQAKKHANNSNWQHTQPLCTLESVALCLGLLENRIDYYQPMLNSLHWVINTQQRYKN